MQSATFETPWTGGFETVFDRMAGFEEEGSSHLPPAALAVGASTYQQ